MKRVTLTLLAGICCTLFASATWAQTAAVPSTGLGQAWPNATDVSQNPHYHVYIFQKDGIKYIQVNDLNGRVLGAFATAGKEVIALPIGNSATRTSSAITPAATAATTNTCTDPWSCGNGNVIAKPSSSAVTPSAAMAPTTTSTATSSEAVYKDASVSVIADLCTDPWSCGNGNIVAEPAQ